jgi:hypothetical protein
MIHKLTTSDKNSAIHLSVELDHQGGIINIQEHHLSHMLFLQTPRGKLNRLLALLSGMQQMMAQHS